MGRFDFKTRTGQISAIIQTQAGTSGDTDAQAFFSRVTAAGGTLSQTEQDAVTTLVVSLKSLGLWTLMKAIYPMVGASAAACAQNLKSSSFTGTFSSGWSFASTGITANGSSTFMDTALTPSTSLSLISGHISIYIRTDVDEAKCDFGTTNGAFGSTDEILLMSRFTGLGFIPVYTQYGGAVANSDSRGFYITNRNSATNTAGFKNNTKVANQAQFSSVLPALPFAIGCQNATSKTRFASKQYAFASIGDGLTDGQASDFYTAVQTFQTSLSRQIGSFDADAQAFFSRVAAAGGSLTQTEQDAVNTLTLSLKSAGIWTLMKAIYPMVGASAAACAQNLKSSSFTGTFSSMTFASTGVTPNGFSSFMDTDLTPNAILTPASFHLSYYSRSNNAIASDFDMGCGQPAGQYSNSMFLRRSGDTAAFDSSNSSSVVRISASSQTNSLGFYVGSIRSTSDRILIKNGVTTLASSTASNSNNLHDAKILLTAYNNTNFGAPTISPIFYGSKQCAFSSIGDGLTNTQISDFYTAVQTFQTSLNRQV